MEFVVLTPHQIDVVLEDGSIRSFAPSGTVARCTQSEETVSHIDGIHITRQTFGEVYDLPEPQEGIGYIVSRMVAQAVPHRHDLYVPGPLVRGEDGQPVGCRGLSIL